MPDVNENLDPAIPTEHQSPINDQDPPTNPPHKKHNCGISPAGRRRSALIKCPEARGLFRHSSPNGESEPEWLPVLHQWRESYALPDHLFRTISLVRLA